MLLFLIFVFGFMLPLIAYLFSVTENLVWSFASQRETIAALRAAGAHEEERDGGEDRDVEQDNESEEDD